MSGEELEEVIKTLEQTPEELGQLLNRLSLEDLKRKSDDEFSALESVCHLRDLEIEGYGKRIVRILAENEPALPDFDGARLAQERGYNKQDFNAALNAFSRARRNNMKLARVLSTEHLVRKAKLEGVGVISLAELFEMMIEHDQGHLSDITMIVRRA